MALKKPAKYLFKMVRNPLVRLKIRIKQRLGWLGIPRIQPFTGHGNGQYIFASGMVIEDKGLAKPAKDHNIWQNILAAIKRYSGDEMPGVRIRIRFYDHEVTTRSDEKGIFCVRIPHHIESDRIWHTIRYELMEEVVPEQGKVVAEGKIMIPPANFRFAVVSDMDDTVIISHAARFVKKLRLLLFKNSRQRLPFKGVSAFYHALQRGPGGQESNPIFYVSNSDWNIYDLLHDFCRYRHIPEGPLLLREFHFRLFNSRRRKENKQIHKITRINSLFETYRDSRFILIGDSGQKDPEIYSRIAGEHPGRVLCIYIRNVSSGRRSRKILRIAEALNKEQSTELVIGRETEAVARHAAGTGYIHPESIEAISRLQEKEKKEEKEKHRLSPGF